MKVGTFLCSLLCVMGLTAGLSGGADVSSDPTDVRAAVEEEMDSRRLAEIAEMMHGDRQAVMMLIREQPEVVHLKDKADRSLLHYAIAKANDDAVALELIARGADVNAATAIVGWTPLHVAAALESPRLVSALLTHGADVNAQTRVGAWTPLTVAEEAMAWKVDSAETVETVNAVKAVALLRDAGGKSLYDPATMPPVLGAYDDVRVFIPWFLSVDADFVQGSFTAVGANERLVFEPIGFSPETENYMTAVGLIDKDGRLHVQWIDRYPFFHDLCVDPLTGLHHAIFTASYGGSGNVPSFLYMYYDPDTGTLTEGFSESVPDSNEPPKLGGVKGGQCRWRALHAEHNVVRDLLGVLRVTGHVDQPVIGDSWTPLSTHVIPSSVVASSLASLRELDHLVSVRDASVPGEGPEADDERMILESPRWKILVVMVETMHLYSSGEPPFYGYGDGVVLVQDKTRGEWRSIFDCGDVSFRGLHDHTLSFDTGETGCYSDYYQSCSFCSATINLLTNEVKKGRG